MKVYYILKKNCKEENLYLAVDQASGGYPYWTDDLEVAKRFDSLNEVGIFCDGDAGHRGYKDMFFDYLSLCSVCKVTPSVLIEPLCSDSMDLASWTALYKDPNGNTVYACSCCYYAVNNKSKFCPECGRPMYNAQEND